MTKKSCLSNCTIDISTIKGLISDQGCTKKKTLNIIIAINLKVLEILCSG